MIKETITIANLKCSGCENTIRKNLLGIQGVTEVDIDQETDNVMVTHEDAVERSVLTAKLHQLGYPEATEENGLLLKIKSYASCMVGRLDAAIEKE